MPIINKFRRNYLTMTITPVKEPTVEEYPWVSTEYALPTKALKKVLARTKMGTVHECQYTHVTRTWNAIEDGSVVLCVVQWKRTPDSLTYSSPSE